MNEYRYRLYYEWQGRTHSAPFAYEKTEAELQLAFASFPNELRLILPDSDAVVTTSVRPPNGREVELLIKTSSAEAGVLHALARPLAGWKLFATRLQTSAAEPD